MQTIQEYVPITKAKSKLLDLVRSLHETDNVIAITKNGLPEAILLSMEKFEGLLETIEILSDEETISSLKKATQEAEQGKWLDLEEALPG